MNTVNYLFSLLFGSIDTKTIVRLILIFSSISLFVYDSSSQDSKILITLEMQKEIRLKMDSLQVSTRDLIEEVQDIKVIDIIHFQNVFVDRYLYERLVNILGLPFQ